MSEEWSFTIDNSKTCTKCRQTKPRTNEFFYKSKRSPDGLRPDCAECGRARSKIYSREHAEQNRARVKAWRTNDPIKAKKMKADYYQRNKEVISKKRKERYKQNPSKGMISKRRRRAREHEVPTESYTWQDVVDRWGSNCHICGEEIDLSANRRPGLLGWERGLHLEHVIPIRLKGPDTLDNVKPAHGLCNLMNH